MAALVAFLLWLIAAVVLSAAAIWVWRRVDPLLPP